MKITPTLQYIDDHGAQKEAVLDYVSADHFGNGIIGFNLTHDPIWSVINQGGPYQWLTYRGKDGGVWQTKIHASAEADGSFRFWYESKHPNEGNGRNGSFVIRAWDGTAWEIVGLEPTNVTHPTPTETRADLSFRLQPSA